MSCHDIDFTSDDGSHEFCNTKEEHEGVVDNVIQLVFYQFVLTGDDLVFYLHAFDHFRDDGDVDDHVQGSTEDERAAYHGMGHQVVTLGEVQEF